MDAHTQVVIKCTLSALQKIQYRQLSYATLRCRDEQVRVCMCVHVLRCGCMCVLTHVVRCVLHANAPPLVIGILAHNTSTCLCVCKAHNTIHTCHAHTRHACRPCPSALMPTRVRGRERWWVGGVLSRQRFLHHAILAELLLATQRTVCGTRCCFSHDTLRGRTRGRGTSKRPRTTTRSCGFAKCATILTSWMGPVSLTVHSPCACALSFTLLLFLSPYFPRSSHPSTLDLTRPLWASMQSFWCMVLVSECCPYTPNASPESLHHSCLMHDAGVRAPGRLTPELTP